AEADRFERDQSGRVQEWKVAQPVVQPEVVHRSLRVDPLVLGEPSERRALVAELVDELERAALAAGEDPAIGDAIEASVVEPAPVFDEVAEPSIGILDDGVD